MARWQPSTLARYLFVAYVLLVVYASLHPFSGWRDRGLPPFAFLTAPLPRPIPVFDVIANIIGYMPSGMEPMMFAMTPNTGMGRGGGAVRKANRGRARTPPPEKGSRLASATSRT